jgi:metal-sulfur cluster biosynthetic enzyme
LKNGLLGWRLKGIVMITRAELIDALRDVIDPELNFNIIDLGLVYRAEILPEKAVIDFTLTYPGCPHADHIQNEIYTHVGKISSSRIEANVILEPPWDESRMSEEARVAFGFPI